jgi:hypothetical protein
MRFVFHERTGVPGHCNKQSCIVSEGTPDLSGRAFNHAGPLPHECGVPLQYPGAPRENSFAKFRKAAIVFYVSKHQWHLDVH